MPGPSNNIAVLAQFCVLMDEIRHSGLHRANFQPWEIEILLDIESCALRDSAKRKALLEYENAVQSEMELGATVPLRFSEFLKRPSPSRKPEARASHLPVKKKTGST